VNQLRHLSTLVLAFNKFFELPQVVKELPTLKILIASGNHIR
jgi:Leucine-rich repeat (LRR) protein